MRPAALAALALLAATFIVGARGASKVQVGDDYFNEIRIEAVGMVRFAKTAGGQADSNAAGDYGVNTKRVHFVDIFSLADEPANVLVYSPASPGGTFWLEYVVPGKASALDGFPIDSLWVTSATGIGPTKPIIITGQVKR